MDERSDLQEGLSNEGQSAEPISRGAGIALEDIGRLMLVLSVAAGAIGIFVFGRTARVSSWGGVSYDWNALGIIFVLLSAGWSIAISWAVMRLGTSLRWLEAIGNKLQLK